jgi:predicted alpha-1,2-mannosidase
MMNGKIRARAVSSVLIGCCIIAALLSQMSLRAQTSKSPADYVNPMIGTAAGGNTHPGATTPWGLIALTPHTDEQGWGNMGYRFENRYIIGFVHNQVSGVGSGEYGNFLVMPARNAIALSSFGYKSARVDETAQAGYYAVTLTAPNVRAELTARARTGHHRYTFAGGNKGDTLRVIFNAARASHPQYAASTEAHIAEDGRVVRLQGRFADGFGSEPTDFTAFFTARVNDLPANYAVWKDDHVETAAHIAAGERENCGVVLNFISDGNPKTIELTTAVSYRAAQNADAYVAEWQAQRKTFDDVKADARKEWNSRLSRITIEGASDEEKTIFYTALYHALLMPTDITGETPDGFKTSGRAFTNYFAIWDTYRTLNPLLTLLFPSVQREMLNSLLDIADDRGWLPDGFTGNALTAMQGGTNADVLFADAAVKRLQGVDYDRAYRYLKKNATAAGDPPAHSGLSARKGRYREYLQNGWLACDTHWQSVSKSLEYAYNDYCVWAVADYLKRGKEAEAFKARSRTIFTLLDAQTGFFRPKKSDGTWLSPFNPAIVFPPGQTWSAEVHYYEGSAWQYLGYVPHDFYGLIRRLGGNDAFTAKWDTLFANRSGADFTKGFFSVSNEPDMLAPFQYIYAGRADRAQFWSRKLIAENFKAMPDGLPGNDDSGTTSAWLLFAALGVFPNAGQDWYFIGSPLFQKATLRLENDKLLIIHARNTSTQNIYVKSLRLNGRQLNRAWVRHRELENGATLEFEMTDTPTRFGAMETPPSPFGKR